jgi:hypothetical protein
MKPGTTPADLHRIPDATRRDGARLIANGGISATDIVAALDATESS